MRRNCGTTHAGSPWLQLIGLLDSKVLTIHKDIEGADESAGLQIFYLYLGSESEISKSSEWYYAYMLIVVEEKPDVFRRVGLMRIHTRDSEIMENVKKITKSKRSICLV